MLHKQVRFLAEHYYVVSLSLQLQYCHSHPLTKLPLAIMSALNSSTGGAHVFITTSSCSHSKTVEYYQSIFQSFGSCGSALIVVPFNQASKQDVEALVDYIYSNLGMDLDYILPFVGIIPENG